MKKFYLIVLMLWATALSFAQCPTSNLVFTTQGEIDQFIIDYPNCTEISGNISIEGEYITNLNGLVNIENIGGTLSINNNSQLTNLNGLSSLSSIFGALIIYNNSQLTDISALDNLDSETILYLNILNNLNLAICNIDTFCEYLSDPDNARTISDNAIGCESDTAVMAACLCNGDTIVPVPDIATLPEITMECEVLEDDISIPTATDNCSGTVTVTHNTTFPITESTQITWTFKDGNGNESTQTQTITVLPSPIANVEFNDLTVTYDGNSHQIEVENLPTDASVSYSIEPETASDNGAINVGTYIVTALVSPPATAANCDDIELTATLIIEQASFEGITFADTEFTYDGTEHSIAVSGAPSDATVTYTNNGQINAGTYEVTALIQMENYADLELTADLIINKAQAVITADDVQEHIYDGTLNNISASLNHSETTLNYAPQQGYTNSGTYEIEVSAIETPNYLAVSKEVTLIISEAGFDGITFEDAEFTYDGTEHSISVSGAPSEATVTYTNNGQINAGTYEVTALIQMDNYSDLELTADLIINKAQAVITADDVQEHIYDGTLKNISASLNHSETALTYAPQQGYTNSGTYEIEVSADETPNYLAVSKDITLIISEASFDGITFADAEFTYDGTEHSISVSGAPSEATVTYTNNGQINAGTYEVTALIQMDNYSDLELTADLIINKAQAVITADDVQEHIYDGTFKNISASLNHSETALTYTPQQGYTNSGTYEIEVSADETPNYLAVSKDVTLIISEAGFDGITFEDAEFTYDGTEHSISVSGAPSEATVTYTNNGQINAGTYEVTALIQMDNYSDLELTADLIINKAQAIITADEEQHYLYDGTVKNVEATLNHAETELQYIPQQGYTEIGVYEITIQAGETENYLETSKIITLIIDESLSVKDISDYEMKLVPNPAYRGKFIQIHAGFPQEELKNMQIRIFSLAGELIKEIKSDQAITEIRLPESMTSATYIVQVNTGKHIHNLKLLVK